MQFYGFAITHFALRPKLSSSTITLRTFSICSPSNKLSQPSDLLGHAKPKHLPLPNHSDIVKDSTLFKNTEHATDPETKDLLKRQRQREYVAIKYRTDPIWRENRLARASAYNSARRLSDPEWYAKRNERSVQHHRTRSREDPYHNIKTALRDWIYKGPSIRDRLVWKTHVPRLTDERIERHCASCHIKRRGGLCLWWERRQDPKDANPLYDCPSCFFKNPDIALPQGFEDIKTTRQLSLRREQLLGIKARRPRKSSSPSPDS